MSFIRPIREKPAYVAPARKVQKADATTAKVAQIRDFPAAQKTGLRGRVVSQVKEASGLAKQIQKNWDQLEPHVLAKDIIELEGKVSNLSDAPASLKKTADRLHFQFVFPVARELEPKGSDFSFAKTIDGLARQTLQTQSLEPFRQLNARQQREIVEIGGIA